MKLLILTALLTTSFAHASDESPYQGLKALFDQGVPMKLSVLPTPNSADLKNWRCFGAKKNTTAEEVLEQLKEAYAPVHVRGKNNESTVWYIKSDGSENPSPEEVTDQNESLNQVLTTEPGLVITLDFLGSGNGKVVETFRTLQQDGETLVVVQFAGAEEIPYLNDYVACQKN